MRKVFLFAVVLYLIALMGGTANADGSGGPVGLATGGISVYEPWDGGHRRFMFTVMEEKGEQPAKGTMLETVFGPDGAIRRIFRYDVKYVRVDGAYAYFGASCTYDSDASTVGRWKYGKVLDGGTPGTAGDYLGFTWGTEAEVSEWVGTGPAPYSWRIATSGNLVVHD